MKEKQVIFEGVMGEHALAIVRDYLQKEPMIIAISGEVGVGKTHLVKTLLGEAVVTSPSFSLMNRYEVEGRWYYHADLYRIRDIEELHVIQFFDVAFESTMIVEWPELIIPLLSKGTYVHITLSFSKTGIERQVRIEV